MGMSILVILVGDISKKKNPEHLLNVGRNLKPKFCVIVSFCEETKWRNNTFMLKIFYDCSSFCEQETDLITTS